MLSLTPWQILVLVTIWIFSQAYSFCQGKKEDPMKSLEQKIVILEEYVKESFKKIQEQEEKQQELLKKIEEKNRELLEKLEQENRELKKELLFVKERLALAETKLLKWEIQMRGFPSSEPKEKNESSPSSETKTTEAKKAYTNPQINQLALLLQSPESNIRMKAVIDLSKIEHEETIPALISALQDKDKQVTILACKALSQKKALPAIPFLWNFLMSSPELRKASYEAIKKITGIEPECNLKSKEEDWQKGILQWQREIECKGIQTKWEEKR